LGGAVEVSRVLFFRGFVFRLAGKKYYPEQNQGRRQHNYSNKHVSQYHYNVPGLTPEKIAMP
jgi:hypothetical protein